MIVDVKGRRGHDLGSIGIVVPPDREPPDAAAIHTAIETLFRHDSSDQRNPAS